MASAMTLTEQMKQLEVTVNHQIMVNYGELAVMAIFMANLMLMTVAYVRVMQYLRQRRAAPKVYVDYPEYPAAPVMLEVNVNIEGEKKYFKPTITARQAYNNNINNKRPKLNDPEGVCKAV